MSKFENAFRATRHLKEDVNNEMEELIDASTSSDANTDDVVIDVVDPNLDYDETPDTTEDLIGKKIGQCPICGEYLFGDEDIGIIDGSFEINCPICQEEVLAPVKGVVCEYTTDSEDEDQDQGQDEGEDSEIELNSEDSEEELEENKVMFDEKSMNKLLNKFVRSKFEDVDSVRILGAKSEGRNLDLSGIIKYRDGSKKRLVLNCSNYKLSRRMVLEAKSKVFRNDSPILIETILKAGAVVPQKITYNYRVISEGKVVVVKGSHTLND